MTDTRTEKAKLADDLEALRLMVSQAPKPIAEIAGDTLARAIAAVEVHMPDGEVETFDSLRVKPLEWLERRNNRLDGGPYQVCLNGSPSDPSATWRVRLHGRVVCKAIKGVDRACAWAQRHHEAYILSMLEDVPINAQTGEE